MPVVHFTFEDAKLFKEILDLLENFVDEVVIDVDLDCLRIRHMTPDRVAMRGTPLTLSML